MKRYFPVYILLLFILGVQSCSEDFQVTAPYKNITFVYGFLDMKDTAHYIRIQKAFIDENKSAIEMAQTSDSSYYANLTVVMREVSGTTVTKNIILQKVNMANEGYPKDSGSFFDKPSYAYKFTDKLDTLKRYRLVITNPATGMTDSSEIDIINANRVYLKYNTWDKMNFAQTIPITMWNWNSYLWYVPKSNATFLEMYIKFSWEDHYISSGNIVRKSAFMKVFEDKTSGNIYDIFEKSHYSFYTFLSGAIGPAPDGVERLLDSCDYYYYLGGIDYNNYYDKKLLQYGLTGDESKPIFSNINGKDVYGLFTTRTALYRYNVPIDTVTLDSLMTNPITSPINFQGFTKD